MPGRSRYRIPACPPYVLGWPEPPALTVYPARPTGLIGAVVLLWTMGLGTALAAGLSPAEQRGKRIYLEGVSDSGETIMALVGREAVPLPASALPCAGCHGRDGRGRPEGGVIPSDITWAHLTKAYGHRHAFGRRHAAFDVETVARAVTTGVDPSGNALDTAMPRFSLSQQDLSDLIAYLMRLQADRDPGLTEDTVTLGTIIPARGPAAPAGEARQAVVKAYLARLNAGGGLYGRRVRLAVLRTEGPGKQVIEEVERFLDRGEVFALTGVFMGGVEAELAAVVRERGIPLVGAVTAWPPGDASANPTIFHLLPGAVGQGLALARFLADRLRDGARRGAIVSRAGETRAAGATRLAGELGRRGWSSVAIETYEPGGLGPLVQRLRARGVNGVFFLGAPGDWVGLLDEARDRGWSPYVVLPGALAGRTHLELPRSFHERVFMAFPTLPSDPNPEAVREYQALARDHPLPKQDLLAQVSALAAAKVLVEGLKRAGRALARERLVAGLEGLHGFQTGLTPPVSYGPNRRIGTSGAYVVSYDTEHKAFVPRGEWVVP